MQIHALNRLSQGLSKGAFWLTQSGFPFHIAASNATAVETRRRREGRRLIRARWPWLLRPLVAPIMLVSWPFGCWIAARRIAMVERVAIRTHGHDRQLARAIYRVALRHNHSPEDVVRYDLLAPDARPDAFVSDLEMVRTWHHYNTDDGRRVLDDKLFFADFFAQHDIPTPRTLAHCADGKVVAREPTDWPERIVVKPVRGSRGRGISVWELDAGNQYSDGRTRIPIESFADVLARYTGGAAFMVQPVLRQHPVLSAAGLPGAPIARVMTGQWPDGRIEIFGAYLSVPEDGFFASNIGFGREFPIDPATGRLSHSHNFWPPTATTGLNTPAEMPDWARAVETVVKAHGALSGRMMAVGWDVLLSDEGPVILEGNHALGLYKLQRSSQVPAADGPLGGLVDAWITAKRSD